ncbi:MAG TPA: guanine deaminase [Xanthobacteraceae bacterium]|nr:guanine deaminase [Xanthobacteraceae bacterium]
MGEDVLALRGTTISFTGDPFQTDPARCLRHEEDGLVLVAGGRILAAGAYAALKHRIPDGVVPTEYPNSIITAGFVDTHVHYPQLQMIGAFGEQLLEWLQTYTFVAEQQFADKSHADYVARQFLRTLLRCGTTTAAVYCTVHPQSVDAFFEESERFNTRMVAGKVLMDRNAPAALLDTAERGFRESQALIARWHGRGRQHYCVTPRYAGSSTEAQLDTAAALMREADELFLQTHVSENLDEIAWMRELFPARSSYLDIYAHAGLVTKRAVFGHGVHLSEEDFCTCHHTGAALAHCPTSNLFLGSGLFRLFDAQDPRRPVRVGLGTDIGAGTSLSQLQSLNEAYKVAQLNKTRLTSVQAFYLATLGGARALYLDDRIGKVEAGFDADLCVLDTRATELLAFRADYCRDIHELLFMLMTLGDDRAVRATYVGGHLAYDRERAGNAFSYPPAAARELS